MAKLFDSKKSLHFTMLGPDTTKPSSSFKQASRLCHHIQSVALSEINNASHIQDFFQLTNKNQAHFVSDLNRFMNSDHVMRCLEYADADLLP